MKKTVILSILAVAALFTACQQDPTSEVGGGASYIEPGPLMTVKVLLDETRLEIDDAGEISWSEGDAISVILKGEDGTYALDSENTYTINHEDNTVAIPENAAYALYPASLKGSISANTLSLTLPHKYEMVAPEDILALNPMKGYVENGFLSFKNLMGFVKVPLTGTGILHTATLKTNCRTTSEFKPIAAAATIELNVEIVDNGGIEMAKDISAVSFVQCDYTKGLDLATSPTLIFPVPAGEYDKMAVVITTNTDSYAIYGTSPHSINRSSFRTLSNTAINPVERTSAVATSLVGEGTNSFDKYASCYIVPPTAARYSFPAILADGTELSGGVVAELKWAEEAGMITDVRYNYEENTISFNTNGNEGNALITLHDNRLEGSSVVWNWHIWITDAPKLLSINGTGPQSVNAFKVMDRVVGATWAPTSSIEANLTDGDYSLSDKVSLEEANNACGVYFQFQNVTPYPRIKTLHHIGIEDIATLENTKCEVMYGISQYSQYWATSSACGTVFEDSRNSGQYQHQAILYPNYAYYKSGTGTNNSGTEVNCNIWSLSDVVTNQTNSRSTVKYNEGKYRFWNSPNSNSYDVIAASKTNHDPCPPGYILENYSMNYWYYQARKADIKYTRASDNNANYAAGYKFYGIYLDGFTSEDGTTLPLYAPCCGNRTKGVSSLSGNYGNMGYIYYSQTNNTRGYTLDGTFAGYGANVQYGASTGGKTIGPLAPNAEKLMNAQAYNVRCRKP